MKTHIESILLAILIFLALASFTFATVDDGESIRQFFSGTLTEFTFTQKVNSSDDILVFTKLISTGAETPLIEDTDYTIVPNGSGYLFGGTVTYPTVSSGDPAIGSTFQVVIVRSIKKSQETSQGAITPTSVVASLDKLTRITQDLKDRINRAWRLPESDAESFVMEIPTLADRAETFPFFDADGNLTYVGDILIDSVSVSAFGETLVNAANAAAANILLGLGTTDAVQFGTITGTTGTFSGHVTVGAGADFIGSSTSEIDMNSNFTVNGGNGNVTNAGSLIVGGIATLGASSVLASSPSTADDSTKIATTEYVQNNIGFGVFTSQSSTEPLAINRDYVATQDGYICCMVEASGASVSIVSGVINGDNRVRNQAVISGWAGFTVPVAFGETFRINATGTPNSSFLFWRGTQTVILPTGP